MANSGFGTPTPGKASEKMCGPACPVQPNRHGHTEPHSHRAAHFTTPDGFPVHTVYADPPQAPPKAYYGFERKGGVRKSGEQPPNGEPQTLMDDPELRPYTTGQAQHMNQGTASHWRNWRSWGNFRQKVGGVLNHRGSVEMEELLGRQAMLQEPQVASPVAGGSLPQSGSSPMAAQSFVGNHQTPMAHRAAHRRALSFSTYLISTNGTPGLVGRASSEIRQPVAHSPVLRCINPDTGNASPTPALGAERGRPSTSRFAQDDGFQPAPAPSPQAKGTSIHRGSYSVPRPGTSLPSSPVARMPSLRRIASHNAANRGRASTSAARPVIRPHSPDYPEDYFSLRYVQLRGIHRVKERLAQIAESRKALEAMELYEAVRPEIFQNIDRIFAFKASIDSDNLRLGGRPEEEPIWKQFLAELESVENEIEAEDERLAEVDEVRRAQEERKNKATEKRKESAIDWPLVQSDNTAEWKIDSKVDVYKGNESEVAKPLDQSESLAEKQSSPRGELEIQKDSELNWPLVDNADSVEKVKDADADADAEPAEELKKDELPSTPTSGTDRIKAPSNTPSRIPRSPRAVSKPQTKAIAPRPSARTAKPTLSSQNKQRSKPVQQAPKPKQQTSKPVSQLKSGREEKDSSAGEATATRRGLLASKPKGS